MSYSVLFDLGEFLFDCSDSSWSYLEKEKNLALGFTRTGCAKAQFDRTNFVSEVTCLL